MTLLTRLKLGFMLMALVFFTVGLRTGLDWQRYVAIGLLLLAVIVRFIDRLRSVRESGER